MLREKSTPRPDWKRLVEEDGLTFHNKIMPGYSYWDESVCYKFTASEIDLIEKAANDLHELYLKAGEYIIENNLWEKLRVPVESIPLIKSSWHSWEQHLYGRFDLLYDGKGPPKLLEYNADTPTSLLESAIAQWRWLEQTGKPDQFNSIHERLIERWSSLGIKKNSMLGLKKNIIHFVTNAEFEEDLVTTAYMQDTAEQSGFETKLINIKDMGWDSSKQIFVDTDLLPMKNVFKLYPWEWLLRDDFGQYIRSDRIRFVEPAWKMMWSTKAILPILWEIAPNHPNLLPAYFSEQEMNGKPFVCKPVYGREGANVSIQSKDLQLSSDGEYGEEGFVYQEFMPVSFDDFHPVLGVWMIGDECGGMGIRENDNWITNNFSRFIPHYFV